MALSKDVTLKGLQVTKAYIKIDRIFGGKAEGWQALVGVYADAEATEPLEQFNCGATYVPDVSPYKLIYDAIKMLPAYADAVDC